MASLAHLEEERAQFLEQLEIIEAQLKDDPENAELLTLKQEMKQMLTLLGESVAELPAPQASAAPSPPPPNRKDQRASAAGTNEKGSRDSPAAADEEQPISYNVNDSVMAKWVSGDKAFYPARITAITGSSTAPVYIVKFKSYDETEKLRAKDIRPTTNKRKADGTPAAAAAAATTVGPSSAATTPAAPPVSAPPPPGSAPSAAAPSPPPPPTPAVISAAASLYPEAVAAKESGDKADDDPSKPPKAKRIKAKKELEAGKNKWQEFSKSKSGKVGGRKDSMFRTPEGPHGRVGFTGSGQAMRKDPARTRHVYQQNDDLD